MTSKEDDASVKIVDFGFAVKAETNSCNSRTGTVSYMAPEILLGKDYGMIAKFVCLRCFIDVFYLDVSLC